MITIKFTMQIVQELKKNTIVSFIVSIFILTILRFL